MEKYDIVRIARIDTIIINMENIRVIIYYDCRAVLRAAHQRIARQRHTVDGAAVPTTVHTHHTPLIYSSFRVFSLYYYYYLFTMFGRFRWRKRTHIADDSFL